MLMLSVMTGGDDDVDDDDDDDDEASRPKQADPRPPRNMVQPAHFALFSLVLLLLTHCTFHPDFETCRGEPKLQEGRQGPKSLGERFADMYQIPLRFPDARVVAESATATGAANSHHASTPDTAKHSGEAAGQIARARRVKRAHQRAVRRARNSEDAEADDSHWSSLVAHKSRPWSRHHARHNCHHPQTAASASSART